jgi:hypothetical protein
MKIKRKKEKNGGKRKQNPAKMGLTGTNKNKWE